MLVKKDSRSVAIAVAVDAHLRIGLDDRWQVNLVYIHQRVRADDTPPVLRYSSEALKLVMEKGRAGTGMP